MNNLAFRLQYCILTLWQSLFKAHHVYYCRTNCHFSGKKINCIFKIDFNCMKLYETKLWPQTVNTEFLAVLYGKIKTNIHLITYCIHFSKDNYMDWIEHMQ